MTTYANYNPMSLLNYSFENVDIDKLKKAIDEISVHIPCFIGEGYANHITAVAIQCRTEDARFVDDTMRRLA